MFYLICSSLHQQIPVFKGAAKPILGHSLDAGHFHGKDGLGDAPDASAPGLERVQEEGAVAAMIRIVNENQGQVRDSGGAPCPGSETLLYPEPLCLHQVSLVATAPLTNLALAVRMDPSLPSKLRGLYIMGGNTECQ